MRHACSFACELECRRCCLQDRQQRGYGAVCCVLVCMNEGLSAASSRAMGPCAHACFGLQARKASVLPAAQQATHLPALGPPFQQAARTKAGSMHSLENMSLPLHPVGLQTDRPLMLTAIGQCDIWVLHCPCSTVLQAADQRHHTNSLPCCAVLPLQAPFAPHIAWQSFAWQTMVAQMPRTAKALYRTTVTADSTTEPAVQ